MKKLLAVLFLASVSYALNAPYLISATALSDSSVTLTWRNNDAATTGFIIQRKDSTETIYHFIDSVKSATQLTYTDMKSLRPTTLYTYQVIAYDATEVSDTSNSVQVTTLARVVIFKKPSMFVSVWNYDTSTNSEKLTILDSADCEIGYRIYRAEDFSSSFNLMYDSTSGNPKNMDTIIWVDTTLSFNNWYTYKVEMYKSDSSLFSTPCSTYTLHSVPQQESIIFQKLSDFPISDSGSWSARAGDSIILKETNAPSNTPFTVINVSNPANPNFVGYIDSATAKAYPLRTLIPVILQFGVYNTWQSQSLVNYKDRILVGSGNTRSQLSMYRIEGSNLVFVDSMIAYFPYSFIYTPFTTLIMFNDTLAAVRYYEYDPTWTKPWIYSYLQPVYLSSSELVPSSYYQFFNYNCGIGARVENTISYFHGCNNGNIVMSAVNNGGSYEQITIYNVSGGVSRITQLPGNLPYANAYSTGHYLSPTENLCTNGPPVLGGPTAVATELFVANIGDIRGHQTADTNNAIYRDTVHLQNTLRNILLDTLKKRVYLIFNHNMSILSYHDSVMTGVISHAGKLPSSRGLVILPSPVLSGVTIVLPDHRRSADLYFYDLSGRVVDRMPGVTSNAVLWRPKTKTMSCYIVMARIGGEKFTKKFMAR